MKHPQDGLQNIDYKKKKEGLNVKIMISFSPLFDY